MVREYNRKLILEGGDTYPGYAFGSETEKVVEIVFNTSMVGYQEILSDPSYTDQAVVMTYPLIGNYGMARDDFETKTPTISGMVVREYNDRPSNYRSEWTLSEVMKKYDIAGISGVDTRKLTRSIRDVGSRRAILTDMATTTEEGLARIAAVPVPHDAVSRVSTKEPWTSESAHPGQGKHIAVVDCGIKLNMIRMLNARGCDLTIFPYNTPAGTIRASAPDGVLISNGPGDPTDVTPVIELIRALRGKVPIFGICLGCQMIGLAYGGETYKMKFGHRGGNHPVRDLTTGRIEITSQNHSYAIREETLRGTKLTVSHRNILDDTVEGVMCPEDCVMGIQYHPESAPGPQDSRHLFDRFLTMIDR